MIRKGMTVRTPDGERLGHVDSVGTDDFVIRHGFPAHSIVAPLDHVIAVDDENDELICRPIDLPLIDRDIPDMPFGSPETADELENRREEEDLAASLEPLPPEVP